MKDNNKPGGNSALYPAAGIIMETDMVGSRRPAGWGTRHTLAILGFWGTALAYAMRFNLSIAIVAMTVPLDQLAAEMAEKENKTNVAPACPALNDPINSTAAVSAMVMGVREGEFVWSAEEQGLILGSFFWGYVSTQLIGGLLSSKYGGKWPFGIGLFAAAVFTLLTPVAARRHKYLLVAIRVLQGMGQGLIFPSMYTILAKWAPAEEKSVMTAIVYAGSQFGTAGVLITSGYLISGEVLDGWPSVFYVFGAVTIIWFICWSFLMYESPEIHPRISAEELSYLRRSLGRNGKEKEAKIATPWTSIVSSGPAWAIQIAQAGHTWGLYTLLTLLPTYMKSILNFDIQQSSWLSAAPYIVMWIISLASTSIGDCLIARRIYSTVTIRKAFQLISQLGPAAALIGAAFAGCNSILTVALITAGVGINGAVYGGFIANHAEIAPNHAGVLMGITNTFANFSGFAAPYVAGLLVDGAPSVENWNMVFYLSAAIYVLNSLVYAVFASASEQRWNRGAGLKAKQDPAAHITSLTGTTYKKQ